MSQKRPGPALTSSPKRASTTSPELRELVENQDIGGSPTAKFLIYDAHMVTGKPIQHFIDLWLQTRERMETSPITQDYDLLIQAPLNIVLFCVQAFLQFKYHRKCENEVVLHCRYELMEVNALVTEFNACNCVGFTSFVIALAEEFGLKDYVLPCHENGHVRISIIWQDTMFGLVDGAGDLLKVWVLPQDVTRLTANLVDVTLVRIEPLTSDLIDTKCSLSTYKQQNVISKRSASVNAFMCAIDIIIVRKENDRQNYFKALGKFFRWEIESTRLVRQWYQAQEDYINGEMER